MSAVAASPLPEASSVAKSTSSSASAATPKASANPPKPKSALQLLALDFPVGESLSLDRIPLACFSDVDSPWAAVVHTCQLLTQLGASSSSYVQASTDWELWASALAALLGCLREHTDRRARLVVATTLAKLRVPRGEEILLQGTRNPAAETLRDVVATDVPSGLVAAALTDEDDAVAARAMDSLGRLVSTPRAASLLEAFQASSPTAPTLRHGLADQDPDVISNALRLRILEHIAPQLAHLVQRLRQFPNPRHQQHGLPLVLHAVAQQVQRAAAQAHSRRSGASWLEWDATGGLHGLVMEVLIPHMQPHLAATLAIDCCLQTTNANNCHVPSWTQPLLNATIESLQYHLSSNSAVSSSKKQLTALLPLEHQARFLTALLVASRALPLSQRQPVWNRIVQTVAAWPATQMIGRRQSTAKYSMSSTAALRMPGAFGGFVRPARIQFWTELALNILVDGPTTVSTLTTSIKEGAPEYPRRDALRSFLSTPAVVAILQPSSDAGAGNGSVVALRDELVWAFSSVARAIGRQQQHNQQQQSRVEWAKLSRGLLVAFWNSAPALGKVKAPSTNIAGTTSSAFAHEDTSVATAAVASFLQFYQDYLQICGLMQPTTSAALKLAPGACPPHSFFDHSLFSNPADDNSSSSASGLPDLRGATGSPDCLGELEMSSKLANEMISRELKQGGLGQHQFRLHLLASCADQWVQGRLLCIRNGSAAQQPQLLAVAAGRDLCHALAPKRLLQKIMDAHQYSKRSSSAASDPFKKWALETVRVCVACLENIALVASDWRKRFQYADAKPLVSVSVGLLQGKVDETPMDDFKRQIMAALCDAAVHRVQACYEQREVEQHSLPALSELVLQPHKTKIKPLISTSSASAAAAAAAYGNNDYYQGYLTQLYRQVIQLRISRAIESKPLVDGTLAARPKTHWFRLNVPPVVESRDAQALGMVGTVLYAWNDTVACVSAPSDPTAMLVACTPRRQPRHDGEETFSLAFLMRAHNISAVPYTEGLRLEVAATRANPVRLDDPVTQKTMQALGGDARDYLPSDSETFSVSTEYRRELASGEHLTWELPLDPQRTPLHLQLVASVIYRNIPEEPVEAGAKWAISPSTKNSSGGPGSVLGGASAATGDASTAVESKSGEDDFKVSLNNNPESNDSKSSQTSNVKVSGEPFVLSPMLGMQPCPLVFMRDRWGDFQAFRFLWFRLPFHAPHIALNLNEKGRQPDTYGLKVAKLSTLAWYGEAIPGGYATRAWAFTHLSGCRVLVLLAETANGRDGKDSSVVLHVRGDDRRAVFDLVGSTESRKLLVESLLPEMELA